MIQTGKRMLTADRTTLTARAERDIALAERYGELASSGLRRGEILAQMEREWSDAFSADELRLIGVSRSMILLAVRRGPAR